MSKPADRDLFAHYHLGLDANRVHRFANLADIARAYGVDRPTVQSWLSAARFDPDTVATVDYNLSKLHVDAMFVTAAEVESFIDDALAGYLEALKQAQPGTFQHDHDYDDL